MPIARLPGAHPSGGPALALPDQLPNPPLSPSITAVAIALGRLDERLRASGPAIRQGWTARSILADVAASSMLDDHFIHADDLALSDIGGAQKLNEHTTSRALGHLRLFRRLLARKPGNIFTPDQLMHSFRAIAAPRHSDPKLALVDLDPGERQDAITAAIETIFGPEGPASHNPTSPLAGAAGLLRAWQANHLLPGPLGRALVMQWLRYHGVTAHAPVFSSIGFIGTANKYRPWADDWPELYLEAIDRATDAGLRLAKRLDRSAAALAALGADRRKNSKFPALAAYVVKSPLISAPLAARALGISIQAALYHVDRLLEADAIRPVTERQSFRIFELAI